jgi:1-acyl-sn-glycerol-3-phosphate acyltransferase
MRLDMPTIPIKLKFKPEIPLALHGTAKLLMRLIGWQLIGSFPDIPKFVATGAPHERNADGFFAVMVGLLTRVRLYWLGKHTLFKPPFGWFVRFVGGIPIDRTKRNSNAVQQAAAFINERDQAVLAVAPEGTRKNVSHWKSGFYYIALEVDVPIVPVYISYERRVLVIGEPIHPTGDIHADMKKIQDFYGRESGRDPLEMGIRLQSQLEDSPAN